MIWFDIRALEKKLKQSDLTDKEAFNYIIAYIILFSLSAISDNKYNTNWLIFIEVIVTIIIAIIGLKKTFDINSLGDNKDYFKRLISLSFVSGIIVLSYFVIAYLIFAIIGSIFNSKFYLVDLVSLTTNTIAEIVYFFILTKSFTRLNKANLQ